MVSQAERPPARIVSSRRLGKDRLVHQSVILELNLASYRLEALKRQISTALSTGGLMVRQATGTIIVVGQKNA